MWTSDDQAVAVGHRVGPGRWEAEADRLLAGMAGRFARVETRRRARGFLLGLLADLPRKNCWTIAEHAGDTDPHGMQHLLNRAVWDTDGVREDLRDYVTTGLGDADAVLVVDETGDLKKGSCTVGVQRQYTGTAGRIENAQVAVLPDLRRCPRARDDRPGAVPPQVLDQRRSALPGGRRRRPAPSNSAGTTR